MSGIEETHPSLKGKIIKEWEVELVPSEYCVDCNDVQEHTVDKAKLKEVLNQCNLSIGSKALQYIIKELELDDE